MIKFRPSFSFWPKPAFLGDSRSGFAAWVRRRNTPRSAPPELRALTVQSIIEDYHDRHDRTLPARRSSHD